jgi:hypothetical protein
LGDGICSRRFFKSFAASVSGGVMDSERYRRASRAPRADSFRRISCIVRISCLVRIPRIARISCIAASAVLALSTAACITDGQPTGSTATPRASVSFESIDGPPEAVFRKLVQDLSDEAEARQLAVVSREGAARYRIRGYVAAHVRQGRTTIAWVWDIYDADQKRALRISGEEDGGKAGKDVWAETDDQVLRRISRAGIERVASFLASPQQAASAATGPQPLFTLAGARDDFTPESAGIFRTANDPSDNGSTAEASNPPAPSNPVSHSPATKHGATSPRDAVASVSH